MVTLIFLKRLPKGPGAGGVFDAHIPHAVTDFDFEYDVTADGRRSLVN